MATRASSDVVFFTREFALTHGISISGASHHLTVLEKRGDVVRITRGVWARPNHPHFTPLACVPFLLGQEQGYVSFLTALHRHGVISQIPSVIQIATTGHSRKLTTGIGHFEFFQLKPEMMLAGVEWSDTYVPFRIASAEKALIDTLYLSTRKGRRFTSLPELHRTFDRSKLSALLRGQKLSSPLAKSITERLMEITRVPSKRRKRRLR